jgi:hypothetical protein
LFAQDIGIVFTRFCQLDDFVGDGLFDPVVTAEVSMASSVVPPEACKQMAGSESVQNGTAGQEKSPTEVGLQSAM